MTKKLFIVVLVIITSHAPVHAQEQPFSTLDDLLNIQISSASRYAQTISEAPASVSIVTSEDIENYGYETLADVFQSVRGFYTSYDRNYYYAGVRGFGRPTDYNNRILLQINGFSLNENIFGSAFIDTSFPINPASIERIEIIRGPGSSLYGTSAMFAVVNIVTKSGNTINGIDVTAEIGSYGKKRSSAHYGAETNGGIDYMVSGVIGDVEGDDHYYKEYDDPITNNGIAQGIDGDRYNNLMSSVQIGDLKLFGLYSDRRKYVPTGSWGTEFNNKHNKTLDNNSMIGINYEKTISNTQKIQLRGYYNRYYYEAGYPYADDPDTRYLYNDSARGIWYGGELQYTLDTGPYNRIMAGIEYRNNDTARYKYWVDDFTMYDHNSPSNILSGYLQDTYQLREDITATIGVRLDKYSEYGKMVSPRLALIYNPYYKTTIKLLHGTAFRVPNIYEADYEEIDYWEKNDDLEEERITTTELVWEQRITRNVMSSFSTYYYTMDNMIDIEYNNDNDVYYYDNIHEVTAHGIEVGIDSHFDAGTNLYANYSLQRAEDIEEDSSLTNSPTQLFKCGIVAPVTTSFHVSTELRYETARKTVYGTTTDSFVATDIGLSTKQLYDCVRFSFLVRNAFDTMYENPGGFEHIQKGISQDGRNYLCKVYVQF